MYAYCCNHNAQLFIIKTSGPQTFFCLQLSLGLKVIYKWFKMLGKF